MKVPSRLGEKRTDLRCAIGSDAGAWRAAPTRSSSACSGSRAHSSAGAIDAKRSECSAMLTFAGKTATSSAASQMPAAGRVRCERDADAAGDLRRAADEHELAVRGQVVRDDLLVDRRAQEVQDPGR